MHIDPFYTDAFNGLIMGDKWWISLPRDFYEYNEDFTCDKQCSEHSEGINSHRNIAMWYHYMLPQIR